MPLRDHFHPPVSKQVSWEEILAMWPGVIVQQLKKRLPVGYVSGPKLQFNSENGTSAWTVTKPTVAVETEIPDYDEYEVRIYDAERGRTLVAAIELVSPANKDRPEKRNAFVGKCAALVQKGVAVSIVDVVTTRQFNLYAELMAFLGHADPTMKSKPPLYAASCRWLMQGERAVLQTWSNVLAVGQPLPTLPLWLSPVRVVPLDLEESYERACDDLSIG